MHTETSTAGAVELPVGSPSPQAGYRLVLDTTAVARERADDVRVHDRRRRGAPVTAFDELHERPLHLIVAVPQPRRLPPPPPDDGRARALDRRAAGAAGPARTGCSPTSSRPGRGEPHARHRPRRRRRRPRRSRCPLPPTSASVDGYTVTIDGDAGGRRRRARRFDGRARRRSSCEPSRTSAPPGTSSRSATGDLAYLHVHPHDGDGRQRSRSPPSSRPPARTGCSSTSRTAASSAPPSFTVVVADGAAAAGDRARRRGTDMATAARHRPATARREIQLDIGGMTCASCAARIEKKLNRMDGVTAIGELRDREGQGHRSPSTVTPADLIAQVEATGYTARRPAAAQHARRSASASRTTSSDDPTRALRQRLLVSARARRPGDRDGDDPGAAVRRLAVAVAHARRAGRHLGRVAVPPGGVDEPAPRARRRWTR